MANQRMIPVPESMRQFFGGSCFYNCGFLASLLVQVRAHQATATPAEEPKATQLAFQSGGEVGHSDLD